MLRYFGPTKVPLASRRQVQAGIGLKEGDYGASCRVQQTRVENALERRWVCPYRWRPAGIRVLSRGPLPAGRQRYFWGLRSRAEPAERGEVFEGFTNRAGTVRSELLAKLIDLLIRGFEVTPTQPAR